MNALEILTFKRRSTFLLVWVKNLRNASYYAQEWLLTQYIESFRNTASKKV